MNLPCWQQELWMATAPEGQRRRGFTLVETTAWTILVAMIGGPLVILFLTSTWSMAEIDAFGRTQERSRVVCFRMERDIRTAIEGTIRVENGGKALSFTAPLGFTEIGVRPGGAVRYELTVAPGEAFNGVDDDGNGLVDDAQLTRRNLLTGEQVVLCSGLDLAGSEFSRDGEAVVLKMTNRGYLKHSQSVVTTSRTRTVNPRN